MRLATLIFLSLSALWIYPSEASPYVPKQGDRLTESWRFKYFSQLDGKGVRCISEGKNGVIWFGVNEGVIEYDGYHWKFHSEKDGLKGVSVSNILAADNGSIYAASSQGVFQYNHHSWTCHFPARGGIQFTFNNIYQLENGGIMCPFSEGVLYLTPENEKILFSSPGYYNSIKKNYSDLRFVALPEDAFRDMDYISDIVEDNRNRVWFAITIDELSRILMFDLDDTTEGKITNYKILSHSPSLKLGENIKLLKAKDKSIWVINNSYKIGVIRFKEGKTTYFKLSEQFGGDEYATSIGETSDGAIWIGGLGKLFAYKNNRWHVYKSPDFDIPASKLILAEGKNDKLWIAGEQAKVFCFDYSQHTWLTYKDLNFQCESKDRKRWFLEVSGKIVVQSSQGWTSYDQSDGVIDAPVRILVTSKNQAWVAGSHEGVAATAYLDGDRWVRQIHPELSWGIDYRAVFEARDGSLWFGCSVDRDPAKGQIGGVLHLVNPMDENKRWIHHKSNENGLNQSNAYGLAQTADGRIWVGGGNLYSFNGDQWTLTEQPKLQQFINILGSDQNGMLCVGSRYYGVFFYDGKKWINYNTTNGLNSNTVISIHVDRNNYIWVATDNDICMFDGQSWITGIFPQEMNMNYEGGTILTDSDGAIWINKSMREWKRRAFSYNKIPEEALENFQTYRYTPDNQPPETRVTLYSEEVSPPGNTYISWEGEDYFNSTPQHKLLYSYRINGGPWSRYTQEKHITFTDLKNGEYTFEVKAKDLDNNEDLSPAAIHFEVMPPVWKQSWFIMMVSGFILLIAFFEYRILRKNNKLSELNGSLKTVNQELQLKHEKIELQNEEILKSQKQIILQKEKLEKNNRQLETQNQEIQSQRDMLEKMVKKVEDLSKIKLQFFTNISHEFRTPLTLILGPIEKLIHKGLVNPDTQKTYEVIQRNAQRLLKLVNQLLEFRRIETGALELNLKRYDIIRFIDEIQNLFNIIASERQVDYTFHSSIKELNIAFDPDKIEKIIFNLLSNAFKYTDSRGRISFFLDATEDQKYVQLVVEDNGCGISGEQLDLIFERFHENNQNSSPWNMESSGIGLSFIKKLVEFHKGKIYVESEPNEGSRFTVLIPTFLTADEAYVDPEKHLPSAERKTNLRSSIDMLNQWLVSRQNEPEIDLEQNGGQKLLIVEDNPDMREYLKDVLQPEYQVYAASSGMKGLEIARQVDIDLAISDIMMPHMNGLEFCKKLKADILTSHIPVILLTAKNLEENEIEGYATGADAYIAKPFNLNLLIARIRNLIELRDTLRSKFSNGLVEPKEVHLASPDEDFLKKIVRIIEENISDSEFDVNRMCHMVSLSHMHFIRKVKKLTGKKPIDLLKTFRLKRAKQLLEQNKLTISEVAYMVGYDLPNSFSRAFRKEFGISPTEFVEKTAEENNVNLLK